MYMRREAAAVGLTCKLLHGDIKTPLKPLTPEFEDPSKVKPRRSTRITQTKPHDYQLQSLITTKSLEVLKEATGGEYPKYGTK